MKNDFADGLSRTVSRIDRPVSKSLMRAIGMKMRTEFGDGIPQHRLAEETHYGQPLPDPMAAIRNSLTTRLRWPKTMFVKVARPSSGCHATLHFYSKWSKRKSAFYGFANPRIAFRIGSEIFSQASTTLSKSASMDASRRQVISPVCSARAARHISHLTQSQINSVVASQSARGINPTAPQTEPDR